MSENGHEIEAKFYLQHLDRMIARLQDVGAHLSEPRVLETNLRFDLPDGSLRAGQRVLRLRHDTTSKLTYKGKGTNREGVWNREEIEFGVEDFDKARQFLEALGYRKTMLYEKYRTTYEIDGASIMLDELPYGDFVEIEGHSGEQIQTLAKKLEIDWNTAIDRSYTALFEHLKGTRGLPFEDLSFKNFESIKVTPEELNVRPADG